MKAIPGSVEESSDFTDSAGIDVDTSWVAETFSPLRETTPNTTHPHLPVLDNNEKH